MDDRFSYPEPAAADGYSTARYEYRCVSAPAVVTVKRSKDRLRSVEALEETLNREARDGWEYVGIDELAILEPQGFFSSKKRRTSFKVIVFRRQR
jgi:hypothetical protein